MLTRHEMYMLAYKRQRDALCELVELGKDQRAREDHSKAAYEMWAEKFKRVEAFERLTKGHQEKWFEENGWAR